MRKETCKKEKFRVYAKKFFLTYSQLPAKLTPDSVISQLQGEIEFTEYVIDDEYHNDGGKHFHVILISEKKLDIHDPSVFNIIFYDEIYKGHCEGVKSLSKTVSYACKLGTYLSNVKTIYNGILMPMDQLLRAMARAEGYAKALEYHDKVNPKASMGSKTLLNLERYFRRKAELERGSTSSIRQSLCTPYKVTDFKEIKGADWYMHIVESIKYLTDQHDSIFFEDMSLESLDEHTILALLETNDDRNIRVLHSSVFKRKGLIVVFAFNKEVFLKMREVFEREDVRSCEGLLTLLSM